MLPEIDPEEGYLEAFFAEALPCESCGRPCESRHPASWDNSLLVGPCCAIPVDDAPDSPVCEEMYALMMSCCTVGELVRVCRAHRKQCATCGAIERRGPARESSVARKGAAA